MTTTAIPGAATSIFADRSAELFTTYAVALSFHGKVMGGVPKDPKIVEGWIRAKAGVSDEAEVRQMMVRTLVELGADISGTETYEELVAASEALAAVKQTNGFKRDADGLYIESRQVKAMLKESVNILFAGDRWGRTKKGPKSFTAERVFVGPERIHLGRSEPDGVDMVIGHVPSPQGPKSTIGYHEYVEHASIEFLIESTEDCIDHDHWPRIWMHAERNGLGALRSQGYGTFAVTRFEAID